MLLQITPQGYQKETDALTGVAPLPKIKELVIFADVEQADEVFISPILSFANVGAGAIEFNSAVPPSEVFWIRGIGLRLEDGTMYAYGKYQAETGGFYKSSGFAFGFDALLARGEDIAYEFTYSPLDLDEMAAQLAQTVSASVDKVALASEVKTLAIAMLGQQEISLAIMAGLDLSTIETQVKQAVVNSLQNDFMQLTYIREMAEDGTETGSNLYQPGDDNDADDDVNYIAEL